MDDKRQHFEFMIGIEKLTKKFGNIQALDNLSLNIKGGEIFGLLGPNGAGKTTVVRILTTLLLPSSGKAQVAGFDVVRSPLAVKHIIGLSPQEINLERELTAYQNLYIHGLLYRMKGIKERINELLAWCGLKERAHDRVKTFSTGMQRRLVIARAVMHRPKVLFLDEPTVGLDPQIRREIWDFIRYINKEGTTILLTTHYIEEAQMLCHRVGILDYGKLIALGSPQKLRAEIGNFVVESSDDGIKTLYHIFDTYKEAYQHAEKKSGNVIIRELNLEDVFIKLTDRRI